MGLYKSQVRGKEETGSPEKQKMAGKPELHQLNNHEEEVTLEDQGFAENDPEGLICSSKSLQGHLTRAPWLLLLLISLGLFLLMLAILVQVSRICANPQGQTQDQKGSSSLGKVAVPQEQTHTGLEQIQQIQQIQQQLTQFNASLGEAPGHKSGRSKGLTRGVTEGNHSIHHIFKHTSSHTTTYICKITAIALKSRTTPKMRSWIGLSDHLREGSWQWVDHSPLKFSFWKEGEPNNDGDEDCVELFMDEWNDNTCTQQNFWVCEQPSAPCPGHGRSVLS
eukprot:XP_008767271.1 PREDICTED: CD209 antigen-like protein E isoform X1 [Rattus norvegicus]